MEATYIGFDGAQYAAKFSPASAKLGGKGERWGHSRFPQWHHGR
jgi:hypothetical protein